MGIKHLIMTTLRYDTTTALTFLTPDALSGKINEIRNQHDSAAKRWPPHMNAVFPFVEAEHFDKIVEKLTAIFAAKKIKPFPIRLSKYECFKRKKDVTFHLKPEDQVGLEVVYNIVKAAFPNLPIKRPDFTAHLTLGQCGKNDYEGLIEMVKSKLGTLEFMVDGIYILQRSKEDKTIPFKIVHKIPFLKV